MHFLLNVHLPGVDAEVDAFTIGNGQVEHLSFAEWCGLDPAFPYVEVKYRKTRPTFWSGLVAADGNLDQEQCLDMARQFSWTLHRAFLLQSRQPLPTPELSVIYVSVSADADFSGPVGVLRLIGPAEREWVVFGSPLSIRYDTAALADVERIYRAMSRFDPDRAFDGVNAGLATLERLARPENWWGGDDLVHQASDFVHCLAACEGLLLGRDKAGDDAITDAFGRQAAVVASLAHLVAHEDFSALAKYFSNLYRLRSKLFHGRIRMRDLDEEARAQLPQARNLLCVCITVAVALDGETRPQDALPALLARAYSDAEVYAALLAEMEPTP
jgi:hypothetical protein